MNLRGDLVIAIAGVARDSGFLGFRLQPSKRLSLLRLASAPVGRIRNPGRPSLRRVGKRLAASNRLIVRFESPVRVKDNEKLPP